VLGLAVPAEQKRTLVEHKELLLVAATFLLYIVGDSIDKFLWPRLAPRRIDDPTKNVETALGARKGQGLYHVAKALAERAKKYEGSSIHVKNEFAKMFRSLIVPSGVVGIVLIVKCQPRWAAGLLVGGGLSLLSYLYLKAAHISDLYTLTSDIALNDPRYLTHDLPEHVRLFF
jgi:hypothetical protein